MTKDRIKSCLILFGLIAAVVCMAQTQQKGVAYRYNGKNPRTPLANVTISYDGGRRTVVSGEDGTFILTLPDSKMGDRIGTVTVRKREMTVFNQQTVDEWNVRKEPLCLILCDKEEFEHQREKLIGIGRREATKKYEQQKILLEKEVSEGRLKMAEMEARLDHAYELLEKRKTLIADYADQLVRIDQSELDESMQKVLMLYENGQVEEAVDMLDKMRLTELFEHSMEKKNLHEKELHTARQDSAMIQAKIRSSIAIYQNSGEYEKAGEQMKALADILKKTDDRCSYANFCFTQNKLREAENYYLLALADIQGNDSSNDPQQLSSKSVLLNNLGIIYQNTQRYSESEQMYGMALDIKRRLVSMAPDEHEAGLAQMLNNMGVLYRKIGRNAESRKALTEALSIYEHLNKTTPQRYEKNMALTKSNMADLIATTAGGGESDSIYLESITMMRQMAAADPQAHEPELATTLNNLAVFYNKKGQREKSLQTYQEALDINRRLAQTNPQAYNPQLVTTLSNMATLYWNLNRIDESEKLYREALSIKEQLAKSLPQTYEQQLPMALGNLAMACRKSGRLDESEQLLLRAVAIDRKLMVNGDKTTFQRNLLNHLRQLAIVYEKKKDQAKCLQTYQEALSESKTLATAASTVPDVETARLLYAIGTLQIEMERYADALQPLMEAEKIFQAAAKREPNNDSHRSYCENLRKQLEYIKNMTE